MSPFKQPWERTIIPYHRHKCKTTILLKDAVTKRPRIQMSISDSNVRLPQTHLRCSLVC